MTIIINMNFHDKFGYQIVTEDAAGRGIQLRLYGFDTGKQVWDDLGVVDGTQYEDIQKLLIK